MAAMILSDSAGEECQHTGSHTIASVSMRNAQPNRRLHEEKTKPRYQVTRAKPVIVAINRIIADRPASILARGIYLFHDEISLIDELAF